MVAGCFSQYTIGSYYLAERTLTTSPCSMHLPEFSQSYICTVYSSPVHIHRTGLLCNHHCSTTIIVLTSHIPIFTPSSELAYRELICHYCKSSLSSSNPTWRCCLCRIKMIIQLPNLSTLRVLQQIRLLSFNYYSRLTTS